MIELKKICLIIGCLLGAFWSIGQNTFQPKPLQEASKMGILYNKEWTINFSLNTQGFTFSFTKAKIKSLTKTTFTQYEVGEIHHAKEKKQNFKYIIPTTGQTSTAFKYGKINNLYTFRMYKGVRKYYAEKARTKGVSVGLTYMYGVALGILKPYYLKLSRPDGKPGDPILVDEKYSEENKDVFLDITRIFGHSSIFKGIDQIKLVPGLTGKIGAHFSFGSSPVFIKSAEVGISSDFYIQEMPLMANQKNNALLFNLYLTFQIGKRS